jgi:hypothetical protein
VINSLWFIVAVLLGFFIGSTVAYYDAYGLPITNSTNSTKDWIPTQCGENETCWHHDFGMH